jgi:hypothetical protein
MAFKVSSYKFEQNPKDSFIKIFLKVTAFEFLFQEIDTGRLNS